MYNLTKHTLHKDNIETIGETKNAEKSCSIIP